MKELTVREIIEMAREYIRNKYSNDPKFKAAYIIGSINTLSLDDTFQSFRDIDIGVITDNVDDINNEEENINGYIVETISSNPKFYTNTDAILSNSRYADNIASGTILLDPANFLTPLHEKVKAEFAENRWIKARWKHEEKDARENLQGMKNAKTAGEFMFCFGRHVMYMTGMLTCLHLAPPTHRRGPVQLRDLLSKADEEKLFEEYLVMAGVQNITQAQAEQYLDDAANAFDTAIEVFKTPIPYAYKLEPFIRPYLLDGTKDIFKDGGYRESIFWIARFYIIAAMVIINDGTPEQKAIESKKLGEFIHTLGIDTEEARANRIKECEKFLNKACKYAESITGKK